MSNQAQEIIKNIYENNLKELSNDFLRKILHQTIERIFNSNEYYIYEILQNALDANATKIKLHIKNNELVLQHNGNPFTESDVRGLSKIYESNKIESIGFMGIGFKSIFHKFKEVKINDKNYKFKFVLSDLTYVKFNGLIIPSEKYDLSSTVLPHWDNNIEDPEIDYTTKFNFCETRESINSIQKDLNKILEDINLFAILFLNGIEFICIDDHCWEKVSLNPPLLILQQGQNQHRWLFFKCSYSPTKDAIKELIHHKGTYVPSSSLTIDQESKYEEIKFDNFLIKYLTALIVCDSNGLPILENHGKLYATFPTKETIPFKINLYGDFFVNVDRSNLKNTSNQFWHQSVFSAFPDLIKQYLDYVCSFEDVEKIKNCLDIFPEDYDDKNQILFNEDVRNLFLDILKDQPLFPIYNKNKINFVQSGFQVPSKFIKFTNSYENDCNTLFKKNIIVDSAISNGYKKFLKWLKLYQTIQYQEIVEIWQHGLDDWWNAIKNNQQCFTIIYKFNKIFAQTLEDVSKNQQNNFENFMNCKCFLTESESWVDIKTISIINIKNKNNFSEIIDKYKIVDPLHIQICTLIESDQSESESELKKNLQKNSIIIEIEDIVNNQIINFCSQDRLISESNRDRIFFLTSWLIENPQFERIFSPLSEIKKIKYILCVKNNIEYLMEIENVIVNNLYDDKEYNEVSTIFYSPKDFYYISNDYLKIKENVKTIKGFKKLFQIIPCKKENLSKDFCENQFKENNLDPNSFIISNHVSFSQDYFIENVENIKNDSRKIQKIYFILHYIYKQLFDKCHYTVSIYCKRNAQGNHKWSEKLFTLDKSKWIKEIENLEWVYCEDGKYRNIDDVLLERNESKPSAPIAKLDADLKKFLNKIFVFGKNIPSDLMSQIDFCIKNKNYESALHVLNKIDQDLSISFEKKEKIVKDIIICNKNNEPYPLDKIVNQDPALKNAEFLDNYISSIYLFDNIIKKFYENNLIKKYIGELPPSLTVKMAFDFWKEVESKEKNYTIASAIKLIFEQNDRKNFDLNKNNLKLKNKKGEWKFIGDLYFDDVKNICTKNADINFVDEKCLATNFEEQKKYAEWINLKFISTPDCIIINYDNSPSDNLKDFQNKIAQLEFLLILYQKNNFDIQNLNKMYENFLENKIQIKICSILEIYINQEKIKNLFSVPDIHCKNIIYITGDCDDFSGDLAINIVNIYHETQSFINDIQTALGTLCNSKFYKKLELIIDKLNLNQCHDLLGFIKKINVHDDRAYNPIHIDDTMNEMDIVVDIEYDKNNSNKENELIINDSSINDNIIQDKDVINQSVPNNKTNNKETVNYNQDVSYVKLRNSKSQKSPDFFRARIGIQHSDSLDHEYQSDDKSRQLVFDFEKNHGRFPKIKDFTNQGYDIESIDNIEKIRRIEIKGLLNLWENDATVTISQKQFEMARNNEDENIEYWLYVVDNLQFDEHVRIHCIKNPCALVNKFYLQAQDCIKLDSYKLFYNE